MFHATVCTSEGADGPSSLSPVFLLVTTQSSFKFTMEVVCTELIVSFFSTPRTEPGKQWHKMKRLPHPRATHTVLEHARGTRSQATGNMDAPLCLWFCHARRGARHERRRWKHKEPSPPLCSGRPRTSVPLLEMNRSARRVRSLCVPDYSSKSGMICPACLEEVFTARLGSDNTHVQPHETAIHTNASNLTNNSDS